MNAFSRGRSSGAGAAPRSMDNVSFGIADSGRPQGNHRSQHREGFHRHQVGAQHQGERRRRVARCGTRLSGQDPGRTDPRDGAGEGGGGARGRGRDKPGAGGGGGGGGRAPPPPGAAPPGRGGGGGGGARGGGG